LDFSEKTILYFQNDKYNPSYLVKGDFSKIIPLHLYMNLDFLVQYLFQLCLILVTFGFLWGIVKFLYSLIRLGSQRSIAESYSIILISYILLIDVVMLLWNNVSNEHREAALWLSGIFISVYFLNQFQGRRFSTQIFKLSFQGKSPNTINYHFPSEIIIMIGSIAFFIFLSFNGNHALNGVSKWFYSSILGIDNAPVFGWIFKLIGAFMLIMMVGGIPTLLKSLLTRQNNNSSKSNFHQEQQNDSFDSFEEM
jgi:hypothetical protein